LTLVLEWCIIDTRVVQMRYALPNTYFWYLKRVSFVGSSPCRRVVVSRKAADSHEHDRLESTHTRKD